jgi:TRAP-type mannitol/chloroaromatic compound transport system permease small subunit
MSDFPAAFYGTIRAIDRFSDASGKVISLAMLYLVATISWECFARYFLNAPTVWVLESSYMVNGSAFMLGCAYARHLGALVRTDMLYEKFSYRKKGWIDLVSYLALFYPALIILMAISIDDVWYSFSIRETSEQTPWRPIMWPFRAAIPLAALLLTVQGVSETLKSLYQVRYNREFEHREKVEV